MTLTMTSLITIEFFVIGICLGSFINVVAWRVPKMMERFWQQQCLVFLKEQHQKKDNELQKQCPACAHQHQQAVAFPEESTEPPFNLALPASHCPHCQTPIRFWHNIPVFSYLWLLGRCKDCRAAINPRYFVVELLCGLIALGYYYHFGLGLPLYAALLFTYGLIVISLIDWDHQYIPDEISYSLMWAGLLLSVNSAPFVSLQDAVLGAAAGYLSLWSIYQLFKLTTGKEGMGYGDFKLLAMLGAWLGWQQLPVIILLASLLGSVIGLTLMLCKGRSKEVPFAFGPYLAMAGVFALFYGETVTQWYLQQL